MDNQRARPGIIRWTLPGSRYVKLNFDGSVVNQRAASGFVIRNDLGHPIIVAARGVGQSTINVVECDLVLRDGLRMAASRGFKRIIVERDSKLIIEAVCGSFQSPWRLRTILADIHCLADSFEDISWKHVFHEANFLADVVTSVRHSVDDSHVWDMTIQLEGHAAFRFDCNQTGCPRSFSL